MAFNQRHWLYTVQFTSYNTSEIGQFGIRIVPTDSTVQPTQANCDDMNAEVATWWTNAAPYAAGGTHCKFWSMVGSKLQWTDVDGKAVLNSLVRVHTNPAPIAGTESGALDSHLSPMAAQVATLLTIIPRGHASRGRCFLPPSCAVLQNTGQIAAGTIATQANNFALLLSRLNVQPAVSYVAVMSDIGAGATGIVTTVRMGCRLDTLKSRNRNIPEAPLQAAAVTQ